MPPPALIHDSAVSARYLQLNRRDLGERILLWRNVRDMNRLFRPLLDEIYADQPNAPFPSLSGKIGQVGVTGIAAGHSTTELDHLLQLLRAIGSAENSDVSPTILCIGQAVALQDQLAVGELLFNQLAIGCDNLMQWYDMPQNLTELSCAQEFMDYWDARSELMIFPYAVDNRSMSLPSEPSLRSVASLSVPGYYAPMGRPSLIKPAEDKWTEWLQKFRFEGTPISTISTEAAAFLALSKSLNLPAISLSWIEASEGEEEYPKGIVDGVMSALRLLFS